MSIPIPAPVAPSAPAEAVPGPLVDEIIARTQEVYGDRLATSLRGTAADRAADRAADLAVLARRLVGELAQSRQALPIGALDVIRAMKHRVQTKLSNQLAEIYRHPDFAAIETSLLSLERLIGTREAKRVSIRWLNKSRQELRDDLLQLDKQVDQTEFYRVVCRAEFHTPGGRPYTFVYLDGQLGAADTTLLRRVGGVAAEAHCAVLGQIDPQTLSGTDTFRDLPADTGLIRQQFLASENEELHSFQGEENAMQFALGAVRFLLRKPYHPVTNPAAKLPYFAEGVRRADELRWGSPGLLLADRVVGSIGRHGLPSAFIGADSGGRETVTRHALSAREVYTTEYRTDEVHEMALSALGLFNFVPWQGKDFAVLFHAPSLFRPVLENPDRPTEEDKNRLLASQLQYTLLRSKMAHRLKALLREAIGKKLDRKKIEEFIERELKKHCVGSASPDELDRRPFRNVKVTVTELGAGYYTGSAEIEPHLTLAGVQLKLKIAAEVSGNKP